MTKRTNPRAPARPGDARASYAPDLLGTMQRLLAALTDLDRAYESDLDTVQASNTPEVIKRAVIQTLKEQHKLRRAPLVRQLEALHSRAKFRD